MVLSASCKKHHCEKKAKRFFAIVLLVCVLTVSLFSTHFILENIVHDCVGMGCYICVKLHNAQNVLRKIGMAVAFALLLCVGLFAIYIAATHKKAEVCSNTLLELNIRCNI